MRPAIICIVNVSVLSVYLIECRANMHLEEQKRIYLALLATVMTQFASIWMTEPMAVVMRKGNAARIV